MHAAAVLLIALAGCAYCIAAGQRWRALRAAEPPPGRGPAWPLWTGLALHSAALACSLADPAHQAFLNGVLGSWAAMASVGFLVRFLTVPSAWLLVLPIGGMALLIAMAGATSGARTQAASEGSGAITLLHVGFMAAYQAAMLVAGAAATLYLVAVRQVKSASVGAFRLPSLPRLEHVCERALLAATALLIGGLATGGAVMARTPGFTLLHPTALLALGTMAFLTVALALRVAHRLGRRGIAATAIAGMCLSALSALALMWDRHG